MATMIGLPSRWERSGPGGSPGLQNQWRGARRGAVGSTPTRSRHGGPMSTDRPRPPSVERLLAAVRPQLRRWRGALTRSRRSHGTWSAEERARLAAGEEPTTVDALAAAVRDRLDGFTDPSGSGLTTVLNATGVILHTNLGRAPWPKAAIEAATRAAGGVFAARVRPGRRSSRPAVPGRRGPPDRADRRGGRARHGQQRRGARRSRSGWPASTGSRSRAASWSRSAAASASRRSSGERAPG